MCNADLNLSSLEGHDDQAIVYMLAIIQSQKDKVLAYKPEVPFDQVSITLQLNDNKQNEIADLVNKSCRLDLDYLRYEDHSVIQFQDVLEKERHWLCITCNRKIKTEEVSCQACNMFRPLEMYPHLLHEPLKATEEEV